MRKRIAKRRMTIKRARRGMNPRRAGHASVSQESDTAALGYPLGDRANASETIQHQRSHAVALAP